MGDGNVTFVSSHIVLTTNVKIIFCAHKSLLGGVQGAAMLCRTRGILSVLLTLFLVF